VTSAAASNRKLQKAAKANASGFSLILTLIHIGRNSGQAGGYKCGSFSTGGELAAINGDGWLATAHNNSVIISSSD